MNEEDSPFQRKDRPFQIRFSALDWEKLAFLTDQEPNIAKAEKIRQLIDQEYGRVKRAARKSGSRPWIRTTIPTSRA